MRLLETRVERGDGGVRLVGVLEQGETRQRTELYFAYGVEYGSFVKDCADPFVPALLVPCLKRGEDLELVPPVSARLARRLGRVQDILVSWHPAFRRIRLAIREREEPPVPPHSAVGALFSTGVDSFYTLLKSLRGWPSEAPPITHLLFVNELEAPQEEDSLARVEEIAREAGLRVIVGRSNARSCFSSMNYELEYRGAALASAALALCAGLRVLLIPSSNPYARLRPAGSDPLLDPLWSTEALEVVHDGCEARSVDKLETLVARDPLALRYLRVCLESTAGAYNCGRCRKCVRTMTALALLGALPEAGTFPKRLHDDAERVLRLDAEEEVDDLLDLARRTGRRPNLTRMLERVVRRRRRRQAIRTLVEETPLLAPAVPWMDRARRSLRQALGHGTKGAHT